MHCKELTTTILSPSPSSCPSRSRFLSPSVSLQSRLSRSRSFCLARRLLVLSSRSIVSPSLSLSFSLRLLLSQRPPPPLSFSYSLLDSSSFFPALSLLSSLSLSRSLSLLLSASISALLLLLPFLFSFLYRPLARGGRDGARSLLVHRERASRDRSRSSTREISFTRGASTFFSPLLLFESISSAILKSRNGTPGDTSRRWRRQCFCRCVLRVRLKN